MTATMNEDVIVHYNGGKVGNYGVTRVTFEPGIQKIDYEAFDSCGKVTSIDIPDSVTSIGEKAFGGCKNLKTIVIPQGVTKISKATFLRCQSLERIDLPNSITEIEVFAFFGCESLQSINIPPGVKKIRSGAFEWSGIEDFIVPDGIETIAARTFQGCVFLRPVTLPSSVREIGPRAFSMCSKLNFVIPKGLPLLKKLNLNGYLFGEDGWNQLSHLVANSPNLEELSLQSVLMLRYPRPLTYLSIHDDDIPIILHLASSCPNLHSLDLSFNSFTPSVIERLAAAETPHNLRRLECYMREWAVKKTTLPALLSLLDAHPKLAFRTSKFWDDSEDSNVQHRLNMNQYGCRGFTVPDSVWPILIQRLGRINEKQGIETGVHNIVYHLLRRHAGFLAGISTTSIAANIEAKSEIAQCLNLEQRSVSRNVEYEHEESNHPAKRHCLE